jgi:exonuclease SbcC
MKLLEIILENFLSYRNQKVDLSQIRLASIVGSNGAGKSTLLGESLRYALFGESRARTDGELVRIGSDSMSVTIRFELNNLKYTIVRYRDGGGTQLSFESELSPLNGATIRDTQQNILNVLKMNSAVFCSSAFILQGKFDEFVSKTSAEKKRILMDALDLNRFVIYEEKAKKLENEQKRMLELIENSIQNLDSDKERINSRLVELGGRENWEDSLTLIKSELKEFGDKYRALQKRVEELKLLQQQYLESQKRMLQIESIGKDLASKKKSHENRLDHLVEETKKYNFETVGWTIEKVQTEKKQSTRCLGEQLELRGVTRMGVLQLESDLKGLEENTKFCITCGQILPQEALNKIEEKKVLYREKIEIRTEAFETVENNIVQAENLLKDLDVLEKLFEIESIKREACSLDAQILAYRAEYKMLKNKLSEVANYEDDLSGAQYVMIEITESIQKRELRAEETNRVLGEYTTLENRKKEIEEKYVDLHLQIEQTKVKIQIYSELNLAFSKKGIPSLIIDDSLPMLQDETNRLLEKFGGQFKVEFVKRDDKADSLDVYAEDNIGRRAISMDSGGEVVRIALALRVALSKLLMQRANSKIELLVIDEPSGLDAQGIQQLIEILSILADEFKQIFVVSHIDELKEVFPNTIYVTKGDEGSMVEIR